MSTAARSSPHIYSGTKPIVEYVNGSLSKEYIYAGSKLLATIAGGVTTYHHPDHLSNRVETDSTGAPVRTFGQLPYGEVWYETGTADKLKFTSYERDSATGETGLDYAMFRYYSPGLGRFMSADLLGGHVAAPQSLSRNSYAGNDPNDFVDPLGLTWIYFEQRFCVNTGSGDHCETEGQWVWLDDGVGAGGDPGGSLSGGGGGEGADPECQHGFFVGVADSSLAAVGNGGDTGAAATASVDYAVFRNSQNGASTGGGATGGAFTRDGNNVSAVPDQHAPPTAWGVFAGTGISLVLGNAGSQTQRNGTFDGILFDVGLGFANLSGSYFRDDNGTWQVAISPFGAGVGLSVTTLTTNTVAFAAYPKSVKTCPGGKH